MFRVDEKKIEHLNSSQLKNLVKKASSGASTPPRFARELRRFARPQVEDRA